MNIFSQSVQFLSEVRIELGKVVWPKWDEFVGSTIIVLFLVSLVALYLWAVDLSISRALTLIYKYFGLG